MRKRERGKKEKERGKREREREGKAMEHQRENPPLCQLHTRLLIPPSLHPSLFLLSLVSIPFFACYSHTHAARGSAGMRGRGEAREKERERERETETNAHKRSICERVMSVWAERVKQLPWHEKAYLLNLSGLC